MPAVKARLAALGADQGEAFWNAVRANLQLLPDVREWTLHRRRADRAIIADAAFAARRRRVAADRAPTMRRSWSAFTNAVKEKTGAKGKALFMPLRQALTGMDHGPEMAALFPLIGEERARKRLLGEAA